MDEFWLTFLLGMGTFGLLKSGLWIYNRLSKRPFNGDALHWLIVFIAAFVAGLPTTYLK